MHHNIIDEKSSIVKVQSCEKADLTLSWKMSIGNGKRIKAIDYVAPRCCSTFRTVMHAHTH